MQTNRSQKTFQVELKKHQSKYVREHSHCSMCEADLEIHHEIDTKDLKVKEEAYCPQCGVLARRSEHPMH